MQQPPRRLVGGLGRVEENNRLGRRPDLAVVAHPAQLLQHLQVPQVRELLPPREDVAIELAVLRLPVVGAQHGEVAARALEQRGGPGAQLRAVRGLELDGGGGTGGLGEARHPVSVARANLHQGAARNVREHGRVDSLRRANRHGVDRRDVRCAVDGVAGGGCVSHRGPLSHLNGGAGGGRFSRRGPFSRRSPCQHSCCRAAAPTVVVVVRGLNPGQARERVGSSSSPIGHYGRLDEAVVFQVGRCRAPAEQLRQPLALEVPLRLVHGKRCVPTVVEGLDAETRRVRLGRHGVGERVVAHVVGWLLGLDVGDVGVVLQAVGHPHVEVVAVAPVVHELSIRKERLHHLAAPERDAAIADAPKVAARDAARPARPQGVPPPRRAGEDVPVEGRERRARGLTERRVRLEEHQVRLAERAPEARVDEEVVVPMHVLEVRAAVLRRELAGFGQVARLHGGPVVLRRHLTERAQPQAAVLYMVVQRRVGAHALVIVVAMDEVDCPVGREERGVVEQHRREAGQVAQVGEDRVARHWIFLWWFCEL